MKVDERLRKCWLKYLGGATEYRITIRPISSPTIKQEMSWEKLVEVVNRYNKRGWRKYFYRNIEHLELLEYLEEEKYK